jgi:alginate O-acetyltransferase complex protein AlgI
MPLPLEVHLEFWQRWHISLTNFITTYLYTSILKTFSKVSLTIASIATLLAMTIAGLWHGPSWTFVRFGLMHGIGLGFNQVWKKKKIWKLPVALSWFITFSFVNIAFILFHSRTLADAANRIVRLLPVHHIFGVSNLDTMRQQGIIFHYVALPLLIGVFVAFLGKSSEELSREFRPTVVNSAAVVVLTLVAWIFMNSTMGTPFVYFAF